MLARRPPRSSPRGAPHRAVTSGCHIAESQSTIASRIASNGSAQRGSRAPWANRISGGWDVGVLIPGHYTRVMSPSVLPRARRAVLCRLSSALLRCLLLVGCLTHLLLPATVGAMQFAQARAAAGVCSAAGQLAGPATDHAAATHLTHAADCAVCLASAAGGHTGPTVSSTAARLAAVALPLPVLPVPREVAAFLRPASRAPPAAFVA